jgi:hypothetical protein
MDEDVKKFIDRMDLNPPTTEEFLKDVEVKLGIRLPDQYKEFMLESNGAEGNVGTNSYLAIWPIEQIVQLNEEYAVNEFTPGLVYFGSDGGGMAYAFDNRVKETPIVEFPFESINIEDAKLCGNTFNEFLQNRKDLPISGDLASKYPNGVKFTKEGFPDFIPYAKVRVKIDGLKGNTTSDFTAANRAAGLKQPPSGYTWHHVEDGRTMMLVPTDLHQAVRHTGGVVTK